MLTSPYRRWRPSWRELERLRREMNQFTGDWPRRAGWDVAPGYPAMNVWTTEDNALVTAELPGVNLEDIDISVEDEMLSVRGDRQPEALEEGTTYHRRERRHGPFVRTFRLPFRVAADAVEANYQKGVLSITLPRAEADKPRKIEIKAG
jgi:HSP20 family protein